MPCNTKIVFLFSSLNPSYLYNAPIYFRNESSEREKRCDLNQKKIREFKTAKLFPILRCEFTYSTYTITFAIASKIVSFDHSV